MFNCFIFNNTTIQARGLNYIKGVPIRYEWEKFVTDRVRFFTHLENDFSIEFTLTRQ